MFSEFHIIPNLTIFFIHFLHNFNTYSLPIIKPVRYKLILGRDVKREAGNKEELQQALEVKIQIKDINAELKEIYSQIREERKAFRIELREV